MIAKEMGLCYISEMQDQTARKLKREGIGAITVKPRKGEWELMKEKGVSGKPKNGKMKKALAISQSTTIQMAHDRAGGMLIKDIAMKYAVSDGLVSNSLQKLFISTKIGREILKGVLLENAIATGMHARSKVDQLNPMQATVAAGIFTDRFIALDKHTASQPMDVDFAELAEAGNAIKELKELVGGIKDSERGVDVDGEDAIELD